MTNNRLQRIVMALSLAFMAEYGSARDLPCDTANWINPGKSLVITSVDVVNNSRTKGAGPWSFANVMSSALATSPQASGTATYEWLDLFRTTESMNGFPMEVRPGGIILSTWERMGGGTDDQNTNLNLLKAPFRLLSIVYRPDERTDTKPFGEGRFVFGADLPGSGKANMTIIFEFALPRRPLPGGGVSDDSFWQRQFAELSLLPFGEEYLEKLQNLTDLFMQPQGGRSNIAQVRTNDQLFGQGWDLREFKLDPATKRLLAAPPAQTPDISMNKERSGELIAWILSQQTEILSGKYEVPPQFIGGQFVMLDDTFEWVSGNNGIPSGVKHAFSRGTCSGCHGIETRTRFLHIEPRSPSLPSRLSPFLKAQLPARAASLQGFVCSGPR